MIVLVCGGRNYHNYERLSTILSRLHYSTMTGYEEPISMLIHGHARGADTLAFRWAMENSVPQKAYPADWDRIGKAAGYQRNRQMLEEGKPDLVIAFPGGPGTQHMVNIAEQAGVRVVQIK